MGRATGVDEDGVSGEGPVCEWLRQPRSQWPMRAPIVPPQGGFRLAVRPPGSKSLTNRALLLAGLASGRSVLRGALTDADDAWRMMKALTALGAKTRVIGDEAVEVEGVGGRWRVPAEGVRLDVGNAGTAARFLAASALVSSGPMVIDGNARMRQRPIGELGEILEHLGARVEYLGEPGCPPMRIVPAGGLHSGPRVVEIGSTRSSQFVSGLLLVGAWLSGGLTVKLRGEVTSASYVGMTVGLLERLGACVRTSADLRVIRVGPGEGRRGEGGLSGFEYEVEPDASGATYFWTAAAMSRGSSCRVMGLDERSLQGDARFPRLLERMGARVERGEGWIEVTGVEVRPVEADMSDMPDATMTLAAAATLADGPSVLRGVRTLRVKETDRVEALRAELGKVGVRVECPFEGDGGAMRIVPPRGGIDRSAEASAVEFETYDDHRMAMSLALIGLVRPGVWVRDPACVRKTYPGFWRDLSGVYGAGGTVERGGGVG